MTTEGDDPEWLAVGASVIHGVFGTGTVGRVGEYKGVPTVWVDFDYGERKALSLEYGLPHLSPRKRGVGRTPPCPDLHCDVCGGRPLVLNTAGRRLCEDHKAQFKA